jgi:hypothetical protein
MAKTYFVACALTTDAKSDCMPICWSKMLTPTWQLILLDLAIFHVPEVGARNVEFGSVPVNNTCGNRTFW